MQIGEVATRVGLSLRTLRHWDETGLARPSARSAGGFRLYTEADVERLMLIRTMRPLDFSLEQMKELVETIDEIAADARTGDDTADGSDGRDGSDTRDGSDEERTRRLHERLDSYRITTEARIETLRSQLLGLERLAKELRRMSR